jgi:hypothetical protein
MRRIPSLTTSALLAVLVLSCKDDGVIQPEPLGDYLFVERTIITDATLLRGDPAWIPIRVIEPSIRYTFDEQSRTLSYRAGENTRLPINQDLKLIFADEHYLLLPHLISEQAFKKYNSDNNGPSDTTRDFTIGAEFWLTPVFFPPHYIDPSLTVQEIGTDGLVGIVISGVFPEILLRPDSTYVRVTTRIDSVFQLDRNWALFEFKDSLIIKNHGFQPKQNVVWNPLSN